ncbi:hypothetical protein LSTR_LSTR000754 [Laodelphax striatellus]|uniref:Uncharacterized protein n=1 Tax=Laodelphax striatellus TaxID=195883 RepID=A0A482XGE0_LAOST|nr:hypothetical protein LSTR_LSTR000754 [Laodelphax striatellus]
MRGRRGAVALGRLSAGAAPKTFALSPAQNSRCPRGLLCDLHAGLYLRRTNASTLASSSTSSHFSQTEGNIDSSIIHSTLWFLISQKSNDPLGTRRTEKTSKSITPSKGSPLVTIKLDDNRMHLSGEFFVYAKDRKRDAR